MIIEILKLVAAFLTPVIVLVWGFIINKRIETNKMSVLKEKEFQVKWAELFFTQAVEYNKHISEIVHALFGLQTAKDQKVIDILLKTITDSISIASKLEWDMQNFAQFGGKHSNEVKESQRTLTDLLSIILTKKEGSLEDVRKAQFEYNKSVRIVHNEILKSLPSPSVQLSLQKTVN